MWTDRHRGSRGILGRAIFRWDVMMIRGYVGWTRFDRWLGRRFFG